MDRITQDLGHLGVPMLRQSLDCVAVENEQRCVTGVNNSLQHPVLTVSLRSIDNPQARLAVFHNWLICVIHASRAVVCV